MSHKSRHHRFSPFAFKVQSNRHDGSILCHARYIWVHLTRPGMTHYSTFHLAHCLQTWTHPNLRTEKTRPLNHSRRCGALFDKTCESCISLVYVPGWLSRSSSKNWKDRHPNYIPASWSCLGSRLRALNSQMEARVPNRKKRQEPHLQDSSSSGSFPSMETSLKELDYLTFVIHNT